MESLGVFLFLTASLSAGVDGPVPGLGVHYEQVHPVDIFLDHSVLDESSNEEWVLHEGLSVSQV